MGQIAGSGEDGKGELEMRQIWKYPINITNKRYKITVPAGANIVHIIIQGKQVVMWFEIDDQEPLEEVRSFRVYGTGEPIYAGIHIKTIINTCYVCHVYEV